MPYPSCARPFVTIGLLLLLSACGDSPSGGSGTTPGLPPEISSRLPPEAAARMKEAGARLREAGVSLPAIAAPLKASDVELYLKVNPQVRKIAGDTPALTALLEQHGMTPGQWVMLQGRVVGIAMGVKHNAVPPAWQGDVAVVTPYLDRIQASLEGR